MLLISIVPVAMLVGMGASALFNVHAFTESPITAVKIAIGVVSTVLVLGRGLWVLASKIDNPARGAGVRARAAGAVGAGPPVGHRRVRQAVGRLR
ncbi:hypothetical protein [Plantactinospora sp. KLBMP9567]|uniref:hypothetical protein n=1 Tax=Plantactinospora sp. KLBMP9567 TaxID=3085900 RepID=UPI002981DBE8|nr:hypothetical protein [Plantactinospora sp. KLBMP9567]MDW5328365.1 hypothetical protein [Plantactinospora sp. KLBMP9567]